MTEDERTQTTDGTDRSTTDADPGSDPPGGDQGTGTAGEVTEAGAEPTAGTDVGSGRNTPRDSAVYDGTTKIRERLLWGTLAVLSLVALVAVFQFYVSASAAINQWVAAEYRQLMQAVFNLVVLLASGIGIALVVRELGASGESRADA